MAAGEAAEPDTPARTLDMPAGLRFSLRSMEELTALSETAGESDEALLARVAAGDRDGALAMLYDRFARRIYGLGLHQLRSPPLAEELVQETFVRVWQGASRFDPGKGSGATFVFTIARRQAIDLWRRRGARPAEDGDSPEAAMANNVEQLLVALAVREALDELSDAHRQVIELAHHEGLRQTEIAERLDIPLGTVKTRSYHALRALRAALERRGIDG